MQNFSTNQKTVLQHLNFIKYEILHTFKFLHEGCTANALKFQLVLSPFLRACLYRF